MSRRRRRRRAPPARRTAAERHHPVSSQLIVEVARDDDVFRITGASTSTADGRRRHQLGLDLRHTMSRALLCVVYEMSLQGRAAVLWSYIRPRTRTGTLTAARPQPLAVMVVKPKLIFVKGVGRPGWVAHMTPGRHQLGAGQRRRDHRRRQVLTYPTSYETVGKRALDRGTHLVAAAGNNARRPAIRLCGCAPAEARGHRGHRPEQRRRGSSRPERRRVRRPGRLEVPRRGQSPS